MECEWRLFTKGRGRRSRMKEEWDRKWENLKEREKKSRRGSETKYQRRQKKIRK